MQRCTLFCLYCIFMCLSPRTNTPIGLHVDDDLDVTWTFAGPHVHAYNVSLNECWTVTFWFVADKTGDKGRLDCSASCLTNGSARLHQLDPGVWRSCPDHNYWFSWSLVPGSTVFWACSSCVVNQHLPHSPCNEHHSVPDQQAPSCRTAVFPGLRSGPQCVFNRLISAFLVSICSDLTTVMTHET